MKRILLISLFVMAFLIPINAQVNQTNQDGKLYQYCTVFYDGQNLTIQIDYGFKEKDKVADDTDKRLRFNSRVSIINYMTLQGWEYLGSRDELGGNFLFRREVTQSEAKELIEKMKKPQKN